jgi:hypothetical protein
MPVRQGSARSPSSLVEAYVARGEPLEPELFRLLGFPGFHRAEPAHMLESAGAADPDVYGDMSFGCRRSR